MLRYFLNLLTILVLFFSTNASAVTATIVIGETSLIVPPPGGLQNALPDAPNLMVEASSLVGKGSRLLILFLPPKAIAASKAGKRSVYSPRYAFVSTKMSASEHSTVLPVDFKHMQDAMERNMISASIQDTLKDVNGSNAAKKSGAKFNDFIKPHLVSRSPSQLSVGAAVSFNKGSEAYTSYGIVTMILVKGKILILNMYCPPSENNIRETEIVLSKWITKILTVNGVVN
jgi:hypothetical protein